MHRMNLFPRDRYSRFVLVMLVLVVAFRAWADYDQIELAIYLPGSVPLLLHHAPADSFRFVFNFPASLMSWLLLPAPIYSTSQGMYLFVLRETASVLTEIVLTLGFWVGIGRLVRSGHLAWVKRVRLGIVLPLFFLVAAAVLNKTGDMQWSRVMRAGAPQEHPVDFTFARDFFVGTAINAPASVVSDAFTQFLYSTSPGAWLAFVTYTKKLSDLFGPWEYFLLVVALWRMIGTWLDRWRATLAGQPSKAIGWKSRVLGILGAALGAILCVIAEQSYDSRRYELWYVLALMVWATVLTMGSIHFLSRDKARIAGAAIRIFFVVLGIIVTSMNAFLIFEVSNRAFWHANPGKPLEIAVLLWTLGVLGQSLYWFFKRRPPEPVPASE